MFETGMRSGRFNEGVYESLCVLRFYHKNFYRKDFALGSMVLFFTYFFS